MELQNAAAQKLEQKVNLMKKCLHQPDFNRLSRHNKVLFIQELNILQSQLKSLKKQKVKDTQRKMYSE
ncbi:hypothetical protein [Rufibacter latericius]|uniref:50S ribosomal protein L29 n=1 Tax=Rufibacter latericius TaxID=2487040 RepID=A0A3M9M8K6_9BACT|nr:hypothetical protein [Rufibacter latericius]RNI21891.1 hypothetical protein EFB08_22365 [Rufibacter latericius]